MIAKLFPTCILPRTLFACELWKPIKQMEIQKLKVLFIYVLKISKGLLHIIRSDMATGMSGLRLRMFKFQTSQ